MPQKHLAGEAITGCFDRVIQKSTYEVLRPESGDILDAELFQRFTYFHFSIQIIARFTTVAVIIH